MGCWTTYGRVRARNHLPRPERDGDPYSTGLDYGAVHLIAGDLNRMERDYLAPPVELAAHCVDPSPADGCAAATGIDIETVRAVLAYVFRESR